MTEHVWAYELESDIDLVCAVFKCKRCGTKIPAKSPYEGSHSEDCDEQIVKDIFRT